MDEIRTAVFRVLWNAPGLIPCGQMAASKTRHGASRSHFVWRRRLLTLVQKLQRWPSTIQPGVQAVRPAVQAYAVRWRANNVLTGGGYCADRPIKPGVALLHGRRHLARRACLDRADAVAAADRREEHPSDWRRRLHVSKLANPGSKESQTRDGGC